MTAVLIARAVKVNDRSTGDARGGKRDGGCTGVDAHLAVPVGADFIVTGHV